jgi:hypothetical protein
VGADGVVLGDRQGGGPDFNAIDPNKGTTAIAAPYDYVLDDGDGILDSAAARAGSRGAARTALSASPAAVKRARDARPAW